MQTENLVDLAPVVQAVLALCAALITAFVVPYVKTKMRGSNLAEMLKWVQVAVKAAEQLSKTGAINLNDRFTYVEKYLETKGYKLTAQDIEVLVESACYDLPKWFTSQFADTLTTEDTDTPEKIEKTREPIMDGDEGSPKE